MPYPTAPYGIFIPLSELICSSIACRVHWQLSLVFSPGLGWNGVQPLINERLCQSDCRTVGECKKCFAFYFLFSFSLWMQCGIQVLPDYANRMPKSM